jgi:hypothetical protein
METKSGKKIKKLPDPFQRWEQLRAKLVSGTASPAEQAETLRVLSALEEIRKRISNPAGGTLPTLQGDTLRDQLHSLEYEILHTYRREMLLDTGTPSVHAANKLLEWAEKLGANDDHYETYNIELVPIARTENGEFRICET